MSDDLWMIRVKRLQADNAELTKRVAELETKAAEVVAELQRRSDEASMHSYIAGYHEAAAHDMALAQAYDSSADLITEKFGLK